MTADLTQLVKLEDSRALDQQPGRRRVSASDLVGLRYLPQSFTQPILSLR